jgi:hypothetical protein
MEVTVGGVTAGCVVPPAFEEDPPQPARRANASREKYRTIIDVVFMV